MSNLEAAQDLASVLPPEDATPVRVGVGIVGSLIVFALIMGARSLNRRPTA
jgi:D-alanyl-D-alanine carboxypeptidase (penicillin-binding protein 5/6)